jgi:hypothetical protein
MALAAVVGVVAFVLATLASRYQLLRTPAGATWDDWLDAPELVTGRAVRVVSIAVASATLVALVGFGAPGVVRALLGGLVAGACLPWGVEGFRRWRRHKKDNDVRWNMLTDLRQRRDRR